MISAPITYDFHTQLAQGQAYEAHLDELFACSYHIEPASVDDQRHGIDRFWRSKLFGANAPRIAVEYKADSRAGRTGNAFVETVSVDKSGVQGWAITSRADLLIYLVTDPETIYCIWMINLRHKLPAWLQRYPAAQAANDGYSTHGILVPLDEFERIAAKVI